MNSLSTLNTVIFQKKSLSTHSKETSTPKLTIKKSKNQKSWYILNRKARNLSFNGISKREPLPLPRPSFKFDTQGVYIIKFKTFKIFEKEKELHKKGERKSIKEKKNFFLLLPKQWKFKNNKNSTTGSWLARAMSFHYFAFIIFHKCIFLFSLLFSKWKPYIFIIKSQLNWRKIILYRLSIIIALFPIWIGIKRFLLLR